jgi:16S rRNA (guanine966-N2)-methyltransferase
LSNSLRIIGGAWRRRVLRFPDALGLRPTPDRVRETLFNWLGQDLTGLSCLDLFAGSGALGFEAASRGAARVVMVERDPAAAAALRENAKTLAGSRVEIVRADALQFAATLRPAGERFDVIFLDPPYRQGWLDRLAPHLERLSGEETMIYAEAEHPVATLGAWSAVRQGRAGQVCYQLLQRQRATDECDAG